jgi:hypothetical protein
VGTAYRANATPCFQDWANPDNGDGDVELVSRQLQWWCRLMLPELPADYQPPIRLIWTILILGKAGAMDDLVLPPSNLEGLGRYHRRFDLVHQIAATVPREAPDKFNAALRISADGLTSRNHSAHAPCGWLQRYTPLSLTSFMTKCSLSPKISTRKGHLVSLLPGISHRGLTRGYLWRPIPGHFVMN